VLQNAIILSVIHNRQNTLESTYTFFLGFKVPSFKVPTLYLQLSCTSGHFEVSCHLLYPYIEATVLYKKW
jgi:hypothetical protein